MKIIFYIILLVNIVYAFNNYKLNFKYNFSKCIPRLNTNKKLNNFEIYCNENSTSNSELNNIESQIIENKIVEYKQIENFCNGEFTCNEDIKELEEIEKELLDIFQKMRKHNKKRVYNKLTDLYKLFKK